MNHTLAWHFVGNTLRDGAPIPEDNVPLKFIGIPVICQSGLHAAERILDALAYASGNTICRVTCSGIAERHNDKFVCVERTILWRIDAEDILRRFSRRVALDVLHLWDAPAIVKQYLETGDESIRDAAWATARVAAWDAAWDAAWATAWDAAWATAWDAAWDAARVAAISKYNDWLTEMVESAHAARAGN